MSMRLWIGVALLVGLGACSAQPTPSTPPKPGRTLGLVEVTIDLRDEANPTASANFIPWSKATGQVSAQAITGYNEDIRLRRRDVSFLDFSDQAPYTNPTRYISATFEIANKSGINYQNMSFLATNFGSTKAGTTFTNMTKGTGVDILETETIPGIGGNWYRSIMPTHAMRRGPSGLLIPIVDSNTADLQLFSPEESRKVQTDLAGPFPGAQVLGYGYVARNYSGGRSILVTPPTCDESTDVGCFRGQVTLAFKVPRINPRNANPFTFSMYFLVADETHPYISQSVEEQQVPLTTVTGLDPSSSTVAGYFQVRALFGSDYVGINKNYLCSVRTAVPTPTFPGNVYLPTTIPSASGSQDTCFSDDGEVTTATGLGGDRAESIAIQSDAKIVVAGASWNVNHDDIALVRYNSGGTLDTSFGFGGIVTTDFFTDDEDARSVAIQSDGKIVVAGYRFDGNNDIALVRYNPGGSLDASFGSGGKLATAIGSDDEIATAIALYPNDGSPNANKIVVAGETFNGSNWDFAVVRYNTNGSRDTSFDTDGIVTTAIGPSNDRATSLAIQPNGKIVVAGSSINGLTEDFALVRYNTNGSLDTSFDGDGKVTTDFASSDDRAESLAIQSDGNIVVAGCADCFGSQDFGVVRYNSGGSLDTSFDADGKVTTDFASSLDRAYSLAVQSDGKIVVGGYSNSEFALVRYNSNGLLDSTFDTDGKATTTIGPNGNVAQALAIQSDGKIVLAGYSWNGSNSEFALARYNP